MTDRRLAPGRAVVLALVLAACSGTAGTTTTTSTTAPITPTINLTTTTTTVPPLAEVIIGSDQEPETLNPYAPGGDNGITLEIAQAIHAGLTEIDGDTLQVVPVLAERVPSVTNGDVVVADDGTTTVTWRIRPEAVWADGHPITGDDVVFTWESIMAVIDRPALTDPYAGITGIVAEGKTAVMTFAAPTLAFETLFPVLIPRHQVEGSDIMADWNRSPWLSAGPFRFVTWEPGETIILLRNERYWKPGLPALERVWFRFIAETDRLVQAFVDREIDVFSPPPAREVVSRLTGWTGAEVTVVPGQIWEHLTFQFGERNRNPDSLDEYLAFRKAVAHALDTEAIAALGFWATNEHLDGILGLHGIPSTDPWAQYDHDPDRARALLAGLCADLDRDCVTDPPRVVFSTTSNADERPRIAALIQEQLGAVGIVVDLELEDSSLFFGRTLYEGTFDMGMWAWVAQPGVSGVLPTLGLFDPASPITGNPALGLQTLNGSNHGRWGTPAVTGQTVAESPAIDLNQGPSRVRDEHTARYAEIVAAIATSADHDAVLTMAGEAERILADQVVVIPLVARSSVGAVWADEIAGYRHTSWLPTWNIEEWERISPG